MPPGGFSSSRSPQTPIVQNFGSGPRDIIYVDSAPIDPAPYADGQVVLDRSTGNEYQVSAFSYGSPVFNRSWTVVDAVSTLQYTILNGAAVSFQASGNATVSFPGGNIINYDVTTDLSLYDNATTAFITAADIPGEVNPNVPDSPMVGAGYFMLHDNGSSAWDWVMASSISLSEFSNDPMFITAADIPAETDPAFTAWLGGPPGSYANAMDQGVATGDSPSFAALTVSGTTTFNTAALTWPSANASGALINDASGGLTWAEVPTLPVAIANLGDETSNIGQWTNDVGYIDQGGLSSACDFTYWDGSDIQPGSWSGVNTSTLNNDAGFLTPPPSDSQLYAIRNATWEAFGIPTDLSELSNATTLFITAADIPAETDPAYTANTYATGMDQGVGSGDSPTFAAVSATFNYSPAGPGDWSGSPDDLAEAVDRLAVAVAVLLGSPIA